MTIASYRKKPISKHSSEERKKYISDMKRLHGSKMKKGNKVLINIRGKNVEGTILENAKPGNTSLLVNFSGKNMRKDIATIYGFVGEQPEEASPPTKLIKLGKVARSTTPRKLRLEAQAGLRPKTPPRPRPPALPPRRISEGVPPNIDTEIANLMAITNATIMGSMNFRTHTNNSGASYVSPPY
tara:strand:- start:3721 stop:4272 length:552 start_codon:yes stop_codon:yes gene_type:complete